MHSTTRKNGVSRIFMNSGILFTCSVGAHFLAGGELSAPGKLILFASGIFTFLVIAGQKELDGPKLALLSLVTQTSTHMTLGEMSGSAISMTISHVMFGFIAYLLITKSEGFWLYFSSFASLILKVFRPITNIWREPSILQTSEFLRIWKTKYLSAANLLRAPPVCFEF